MKTLEKILSIVSLAGALAACGADNGKESCTKDSDCNPGRECDSELGYCVDANGSNGSSSGNYSNPCGNSPVYNTFLWCIECNWSLQMNDNCEASTSLGDSGTYSGLNVTLESGTYQLDPNFRFKNIEGQKSYWKEVNKKLDQYNGYVLLIDGCQTGFIDDCAFVSVKEPWAGAEACRKSKYYYKN
ncbi:MAG: hypothetical protein AB1668_07645 [Nanoarchaeota archaeon]